MGVIWDCVSLRPRTSRKRTVWILTPTLYFCTGPKTGKAVNVEGRKAIKVLPALTILHMILQALIVLQALTVLHALPW